MLLLLLPLLPFRLPTPESHVLITAASWVASNVCSEVLRLAYRGVLLLLPPELLLLLALLLLGMFETPLVLLLLLETLPVLLAATGVTVVFALPPPGNRDTKVLMLFVSFWRATLTVSRSAEGGEDGGVGCGGGAVLPGLSAPKLLAPSQQNSDEHSRLDES